MSHMYDTGTFSNTYITLLFLAEVESVDPTRHWKINARCPVRRKFVSCVMNPSILMYTLLDSQSFGAIFLSGYLELILRK